MIRISEELKLAVLTSWKFHWSEFLITLISLATAIQGLPGENSSRNRNVLLAIFVVGFPLALVRLFLTVRRQLNLNKSRRE